MNLEGIEPQQPRPEGSFDLEKFRREQLTRLGHQLLDGLEGAYLQAWGEASWLERKKAEIAKYVAEYTPGKKAPERTPFESTSVQDVCRILEVYLEDTRGLMDIPSEVIMLFEDDHHTRREKLHKNGSITSAKTIRERLKEIVEKKSKSLKNTDYRPLVVVGYRHRRNYGSGSYRNIQEESVLDAGNADVLFWNPRGDFMRTITGIKARTIIVDEDTGGRGGRFASGTLRDFDLDCDVLGVTTGGKVGSKNLRVKKGIVQVGGKLLSQCSPLVVEQIHQIGGVNNAPSISVNHYTQLAGENHSAHIIVLGSYHLGEGAKLAARHVWISDGATFTTEGGAVVAYPPHKGMPPEHIETIDDIYKNFGKELVKYYFPHDTESWSEMQVLLDAWFDDFLETHKIPHNFLKEYGNILTEQHRDPNYLYGDASYTATFGIIANLVAFFYLNRLAPLPKIDRSTFIDTTKFKEFAQSVKDAGGDNVLIFLNGYPEHKLPSKFVIARKMRFGDGTVFKGGMDRDGSFMQHIGRLTAQTVIINSHHDTKSSLGDSSMEYADHIIHISCDNLGVMMTGQIDQRTHLECNESILQYGNIERVKSIQPKKGQEIKVHMQEAGTNEAQKERCLVYEQRGGTMSVEELRTNRYELKAGKASSTKIIAGRVDAVRGTMLNVVIESDQIHIGEGVQIEGTLTIYYHKGFVPDIKAAVVEGKGKIILQEVGDRVRFS